MQMQQHENTPGSDKWRLHVSQVAAETGLSGRTGLFEEASKTYNPAGSTLAVAPETTSKSAATLQESQGVLSSPSDSKKSNRHE